MCMSGPLERQRVRILPRLLCSLYLHTYVSLHTTCLRILLTYVSLYTVFTYLRIRAYYLRTYRFRLLCRLRGHIMPASQRPRLCVCVCVCVCVHLARHQHHHLLLPYSYRRARRPPGLLRPPCLRLLFLFRRRRRRRLFYAYFDLSLALPHDLFPPNRLWKTDVGANK